jgi:hypothetical protein
VCEREIVFLELWVKREAETSRPLFIDMKSEIKKGIIVGTYLKNAIHNCTCESLEKKSVDRYLLELINSRENR